MRPSWPRVEQRQRKEAPLETAICMLIWPQVSLPSGTMMHSCVETRLHRDVRITLPRSSGTRHCGWRRVGDSARHQRRRRPKFWTTTGQMELPPEDPELEDQFGSLGPCSDRIQECFVGHEKRHTNIHGGQGSGLSSKTCKRLFPCGRCGCFRWF